MIPAVTIKTIQFEQLNRQLEGLQTDLKVKARKAGLLAMTQPLSKRIRGDVPVETSALRSSIGHHWVTDPDIDAAVRVGAVRRVTTGIVMGRNGKGDAVLQSRRRLQYFKMMFLEEGTKRHLIRARHNKQIWIKGRAVGSSVNHPGIKARWILRKALQSEQSNFLKHFTAGAARALAKYGVTVA